MSAEDTFTLLPVGTVVPEFRQVTSVSVVPFDDEGKMAVAMLGHRGIDIPGGHVEPEDTDVEATARRETLEEICATLGALKLVGVIESSRQRDEKPTFMVVMTANVETMEPLKFAEGEQSRDRLIVSVDEFLERHRGFPLMAEIVRRAQEIHATSPAPAAS